MNVAVLTSAKLSRFLFCRTRQSFSVLMDLNEHPQAQGIPSP